MVSFLMIFKKQMLLEKKSYSIVLNPILVTKNSSLFLLPHHILCIYVIEGNSKVIGLRALFVVDYCWAVTFRYCVTNS